MEAAVLYCGARRTAYCQELLESNGFRLTQICAAGEDSQMARMGILLSKNQLLLILGPEHNGEPTFGKPFFRALHVPTLDENPQGILVLHGKGCIGWLIESREQAVALLPDRPEHLQLLLPELWLRLCKKFGLSMPEIQKSAVNYEQAVERDFSGKE